jgi:hypothetical protein
MLSMMYVKHVLEPTTVTDSHLIVKIEYSCVKHCYIKNKSCLRETEISTST